MSVLGRVLLAAGTARAAYIVLALLSDLWLSDYDTSSGLTSSSCSSTWPLQLAGAPHKQRQPLLVWDFLFMHRIAACGYEYEQYYAFFPAVPGLAAIGLATGVPAALVVMAFNFVALLVSVACLYKTALLQLMDWELMAIIICCRLTLRVCGSDQQLAVLSCLLLALGPATIHHAMPYSEALFTAASFVGLYCLYCHQQHLLAALAFAVSTATRSNGLLNAGYLLHEAGRTALAAWPHSKPRAAAAALRGVLCSVLVAVPYLLFQAHGYAAFCRSGALPTRPWCSKRLPSIYGWVQEHYWDVGLFRYYKLQQVPNFLLAAPTLLLSAWGLASYTAANQRHMLWGGLLPAGKERPSPQGVNVLNSQQMAQAVQQQQQQQPEGEGEASPIQQTYWLRQRKGPSATSRTPDAAEATSERLSTPKAAASTVGPQRDATPGPPPATAPGPVLPGGGPGCGGRGGYLSPDAAVFMVHWGVMVAVCVSVVHIQVSTRLLSCCVPWYWWAAHLVQRSLPQQPPASGGKASRAVAVGGSRAGLWVGSVLWGYCGILMAAGAVLFPNFYPWT